MNKFVSLMGLCLRAHKLSLGHDAVIDCVRKQQASLILLTKDASDRHLKEITAVAPGLTVLKLCFTADELAPFLGKRCCIFSVNDMGFANAIYNKYHEEVTANGIEV